MSLAKPNIIDALGVDEATGRVILLIRHEEPWDGSDEQLYQLQEKLNAYLSFALDGEMEEASPDFAGRAVMLVIDSTEQPDPRTMHLLAHVRQQIAFQDIPLELRVRNAAEKAGGCGSADCGCKGH
jgi:hypothetical protein